MEKNWGASILPVCRAVGKYYKNSYARADAVLGEIENARRTRTIDIYIYIYIYLSTSTTPRHPVASPSFSSTSDRRSEGNRAEGIADTCDRG